MHSYPLWACFAHTCLSRQLRVSSRSCHSKSGRRCQLVLAMGPVPTSCAFIPVSKRRGKGCILGRGTSARLKVHWPHQLCSLLPAPVPLPSPVRMAKVALSTHESDFHDSVPLKCIWSPERISLHCWLYPFHLSSGPWLQQKRSSQLAGYVKDTSFNPYLYYPKGVARYCL